MLPDMISEEEWLALLSRIEQIDDLERIRQHVREFLNEHVGPDGDISPVRESIERVLWSLSGKDGEYSPISCGLRRVLEAWPNEDTADGKMDFGLSLKVQQAIVSGDIGPILEAFIKEFPGVPLMYYGDVPMGMHSHPDFPEGGFREASPGE